MAMQSKTATKFSGLADYPNSLSEVPAGALQLARNVVIDRPSVISPRRGQRVYSAFSGTNILTRLFQVASKQFGFFTFDGAPTSEGTIIRVDAGASEPSAANGTYRQPPGNAMHGTETNNNLFLSTLDGIQKLMPAFTGGSTGKIVPAGMPYGLDVKAALASPGSALGFLAGGSATAYRVLFGSTDQAGNLVLGAPSPSVTLANPVLTGLVLNNGGSGGAGELLTATLSFTPALTGQFDAKAVQGSVIRDCTVVTTSGSTTALVGFPSIADGLYYFGPVGTSFSLVVPFTIQSVVGSTVLTVAGVDARTLGTGSVIYQAYNAAAPTDISSAAQQSTISAATATTITAASGVWLAGSGAMLGSAVISTAQTNVVGYGGTVTPQVNDEIELPGSGGGTGQVAAVNTGAQTVTFLAFPTGLQFSSTGFGTAGVASANLARPQNATVTFSVPAEVQAYATAGLATFYQLYRSYVQALPLADGSFGTPTDNMQLAYQATLDGTAVQISVADIAPDATLGTDLYTSPRQDGILAAKYPPPVASDMCLYQGSMLYGNAFIPASFSTQLIGVSSTTSSSLAALQPGDVITVNGTAFTARASSPGTHEFLISTGSGSVTTDINTTVANLSRVVNQARVAPTSAGSTLEQITLLSTAAQDTMGGTFTVQTSRGLGTFTLAYTPVGGHPSPFSVALPGTYSPTELQNNLFYTPPGEPEAVPLTNSLQVGQANTGILRVLALTDGAIVFKPEGIYQLTGTNPTQFVISLLNTTAQLLANESAVSLQSSVMAFTNQGVVTVSQGGVQITSMAINDTLRALTALPTFASTAFGVAHEAERRYMLWTPTLPDDALPTQAFTYNILTNAWTVWPIPRVCGLVNRADQLLYTGAVATMSTDNPGVYVETAPGAAYGYGDDASVGDVLVIDAVTLDFIPTALSSTAIVAAFTPGCAIVTPVGTLYPTAAANFSERVRLTVPSTLGLNNSDPATYYQAYSCQFAPVPIVGDDAGNVKQFQEFEFAFVNTNCPNITATCATDFNTDYRQLNLAIVGLGGLDSGYGSGPWGSFPWGVGAPSIPLYTRNVRQLVAKGATRGHYFLVSVLANVAANTFNVQGMTLSWTPNRSLRSR